MTSPMTTAELKGQIKAYRGELEHYKTYASALKLIFQKAFPSAVVQAREKSVSSFAEKAVRRRDKYPDAVHMLTDLCGVRIIVQTLEQVAAVRSFIETQFQVLEFDDKSKSLHEDEFGYCDVHYIVQLRVDRDLGLSREEWEKIEWDKIGERKAEIQVRTVLQHGWAEILHDRIYKTAVSVPPEWRREANRLAALLEKADAAFSSLATSLDAQTSVYEVCLPKGKLEAEIETLRTFLALEEDQQRKCDVTLKLAKLLVTSGRWGEVVDLLKPYAQGPAEFALERGYALCCLHADAPDSEPFGEGMRQLESVALLNDPVEDPGQYDPSAPVLGIGPNLRAKAFYRLGRIHALCRHDLKAAVGCFQKAHALRSDNPYYHVAYVLAQLCVSGNEPLLPLVASSLRKDIEYCRHHVTLGIELPNALFTIARCRLLLGEISVCLCAYAKAIQTVLKEDTCVPPRVLSEEIQIVACLSHLNEPIAEQVLVLLHLARWKARFSASEAEASQKWLRDEAEASQKWLRDWLEKQGVRHAPFKTPVLLVIGGADKMAPKKASYYDSYLYESLEYFQGTVVCGGTRSGIPGAVGRVTEALRERDMAPYDLIGYLPENQKSNAHPSYTIVYLAPAKDFSMREAIVCWCDLLLGGVNPEEIVALGINGGEVASFEFRLALAFGARVGVLQDSGREAASLLADPDWQDHPRLCVLPEDKLVVWAFANQHNNPMLTPDQIKEAAPEAHEFYRQHRWNTGQTNDPALKPWKDLDEKLKYSNYQQISFITNNLRKSEFTIAECAAPQPIRFTPEEIEELAEREHARFVMERLSQGWVFGEKKDLARKTSPYLVPWDKVPPDIQEIDRQAVRLFSTLLAKLGYEIRR